MNDNKAEEYVEIALRNAETAQLKLLKGVLVDLLYDSFLAGRYQERKDIKKKIKEVLHEINYESANMERVLLMLEDILAC